MKSLSFIIDIALKHLVMRRRQGIAAVLAVAMGSMILLVTMAMMEGLLGDFRGKLLEASPPVSVEARQEGKLTWLGAPDAAGVTNLRRGGAPNEREDLPRYPELEALILSVPGVVEAAPRACTPVIIFHGTRSQRSITCGIDPGAERQVTRLWKWMQSGKMEDLESASQGIIMGNMLARRLSVKVGSQVRLISPAGVTQNYRVIGTFASGITKIDESQSYVRLSEGRILAGLAGGSVTAVGVGVEPIEDAGRVAREISRMSGHEALTWEQANRSALVSFRMMGIVTYFLVVFTAVVGGFGILNIMVTIVMEKVKDIAILRAMGVTRGQVLRVFFAESMILGVFGGALGLLAGTGLSLLIESIPYTSSDASQIQREVFTMLLEPQFYVISFVLSLMVSVAAGVIPARRAARVDPVEVLRGER